MQKTEPMSPSNPIHHVMHVCCTFKTTLRSIFLLYVRCPLHQVSRSFLCLQFQTTGNKTSSSFSVYIEIKQKYVLINITGIQRVRGICIYIIFFYLFFPVTSYGNDGQYQGLNCCPTKNHSSPNSLIIKFIIIYMLLIKAQTISKV